MSDEKPGVYKKIAHVMRQVERIPKSGRNEFHKYDYVTEADLTEHIRPLMADIGLVLIPSQTEHRLDGVVELKNGGTDNVARIWHEFTFADTEDGSTVTFGVWGEGQDGGDKGSYKAFTGAMKYALMKAFLVATGDDPEQDRHGGPVKRQAKAKKKPEPLDAPPGDLDLSDPATQEQVDEIRQLYLALAADLTPPQKKRCNQAMIGTSEQAAKTIEWLTDKANSLAAAGA